MAKKNNEYVVSLRADVKGLKEDIKSELKSVLREVDNIGDAISDGLTPDTKEFESKITSLEANMEKLAQNTKNVEQQVASMKTAFKGFTELEAKMKVIGEQNKEMYDMFVKMTPFLHEFANTFATMKPDQAITAMSKVMSQMSVSGQASSQVFKDVKSTMDDVANSAEKLKANVHEIETGVTGALNTETNTIETRVNSASKMADEAKRKASEAEAELRRIESLSKKSAYKGISDSDDDTEHNKFVGEIERLQQIADEDYVAWTKLEEGATGYNAALKKAAESAANFLSILENVKDVDEKTLFKEEYYASSVESSDMVLEKYTNGLKEASVATQELQKVSLKPLKLKVDLSTDDELIAQINKAIERIQGNTKINPIKIPLDFIDVGEEEIKKNNQKKKKTKNVKVNTGNRNQEEIEVDSRLGSVVKEIESLQKSFDKIKTPLLNDIQQWRNNLEEYLTLQFKWKKGDKEGIIDLFDDINHYAETNPIWLNPDTDKLVTEIETALAQHQFKLNLNGSGLNVSGNISGAIPVSIVGSNNNYQTPTIQKILRQSTPSSTISKSEIQKDVTSVDKNSQVVEKNSDVIADVINEFKTYSQKTNDAITRSTKTIEKLTAQNEKLDKNNPEDAEKIVENQNKIKKEQSKIDTARSRMSALSATTGIDVQNINNIDNDTLIETVTHLVQDRNEIVDVINTTKIGGASNSKTFLTKGIRDIVDSIKTAQESLDVEMKSADTVSKEIAAKDYLQDAEQLTRMGMVLKTANREIRNNIVPTEDSLQQVVDVFGGRGLTSVTQSAQNLKGVLEQYHDVFEADGGYQEYITRLNDEIIQLQSEIDELSAHPRKNKAAIAEKKGQLGVKQFELEEIQSNVEPVLNIFKESVKGLPGQIAELLKGYKFIVEFVDADGKKVTESFNDASARAPQNTEPYYKRSTKMFDRINAGEITRITPKSTPNDSAFSILYGDKISKSTAIQQIIDAYNQLDKKAKLFVNSLIDIKKLTDENISLSEKWALVENSGIIGIDMDKKGQARMGRSINVNKAIGVEDLIASKKKIISNKSKIQSLDPEKDKDKIADLTEENKSLLKNIANIKAANREIDSFIDTIVGAYFGVNSNAKLKAGQQKMLMRGTPISYGSSKNATVAHPEERKYEYSATNRAYRTIPNYEQKTIEQLNAELEENKTNTDAVNAQLTTYKESLAQAQEAHKKEYEKQLGESDYSSEKLKKMQEQFSDVKSYDDFVSTQETLKQNANSARESKAQIEKQNQQNDQAIKDLSQAIKSRENYIEKLKELASIFNKKNNDSVSKTIGNINDKELKDTAYNLGIQTYKNGKVKDLTRNEYKNKINEALSQLEADQIQDQQSLVTAQNKLENSTQELEVATNNASDAENKLKDLRTAFATEYVQHLQNLINNVRQEEKQLNIKERAGTATEEDKAKARQLRLTAGGLIEEKEKYKSITNPKIKTGYEGQISQLEASIKTSESKLNELEIEKTKIENKISDITNDVVPIATTPVESGSEEAKTLALREVEAINADFELADKKIDVAEQKKQELDNRIKVLQKKGVAASEVKQSQSQATSYAVQTAKSTDDYKEFQRNLHQQFTDGAITWDEYSEKIQAKIDEIVNKLKEAEPEKYTGKSAEELEVALTKEKQIQQEIIDSAKAYKQELQVQRQEAMAFAQITEEELANQRAITEEKKEQLVATQQESVTNKQEVVEQIQKQENQVQKISVNEVNKRINEIDSEIADLRQIVNSKSTTKKVSKEKATLTPQEEAIKSYSTQIYKNATNANKEFYGTLTQKQNEKGQSYADFSNAENLNKILAKAKELLSTMYDEANVDAEKFIELQEQLSRLLSTTKMQADKSGTIKKNDFSQWLVNNNAKDLSDFMSSSDFIGSKNPLKNVVSNKLGLNVEQEVKKVGEETVTALQESAEKGFADGVKGISKKEAKQKIKQLEEEKTSLVSLKDSYTKQPERSYISEPISANNVDLQTQNVVIGGGFNDYGKWALDSTLLKTNEILSSISGKIDSVKKDNTSSGNSTSTKASNKSEKDEVDIDSIRNRLTDVANKNLESAYGKGTAASRTFNEQTKKLVDTLTVADGQTVKFTYSINKMTGDVDVSRTEMENFNGVAKKAYAELGKFQLSTNNLLDTSGLTVAFPEKALEYQNALNNLKVILGELDGHRIAKAEDAQNVENATKKVKDLRTEIEKIVSSSEKLSKTSELVKDFGGEQINDIRRAMENVANEQYSENIFDVNFEDSIDGLTTKMTFMANTGKKEVSQVTYEFNKLNDAIYQTGIKTNKTKGLFTNFFGDLKNKITELLRYYAGMNIIQQSFQYIRQGVTYVREIDSALTELKKVTDETDTSYNKFLQDMSKTAAVIGTTVKDLTASAADWARLGLTN